MTAMQRAIHRYHELLTDELAAESQGWLDAQQQRHELSFGDRPLCTVLRPRFMSHEQYRYVRSRAGLVMRAFEKLYARAMVDPAFRSQLRLMDWEEELIRHDPGFPDPSPTGRLDAVYVEETGELRFMEYNAEVPAAVAYTDVLSEVFYSLPVMGRFVREYSVLAIPTRHNVMHALLDSYVRWGGRREAPRIAILDWREVPTYTEFVLFTQYFRAQGLECRIVDPREVEYRNGRLCAGDYEIDLVYKRILTNELVGRCGLEHPVVRAAREGVACVVNPFRCKLLHKKASFAVLSDERNLEMFSADELGAVEAHIPWTRVVEDRRTLFRGRWVDLLPFIVERRDELVLKANDEYGGRGVILGWRTEPAEWERAVRTAVDEPFIVQQKLDMRSQPFPALVDGRVRLSDRMMDTSPFVFHASYVGGCLTRLSMDPILNVTAGGGSTVPTFLVEDR